MGTAFERAYKRTVSNMTVAKRVAGYTSDDTQKGRASTQSDRRVQKAENRTASSKGK